MKPVHEVLTDALALLDDGRAWVPSAAYGPRGVYCIMGAISHVACDSDKYKAYDAMRVAVGADFSDGNTLPFWNDTHDFHAVKGAFCRAIEATTPKVDGDRLADAVLRETGRICAEGGGK